MAPPGLHQWLVRVKQGVDLHTSTFNQALAAEYLSGGFLEKHLPRILDLYRPRQAAMLQALATYFPDEFSWSRPDGGMFIWAKGPTGLNMESVYWRAVERAVAFVPGKFFFAHPGEGLETMRLNFTMAPADVLDTALKTLAGVVREQMQAAG